MHSRGQSPRSERFRDHADFRFSREATTAWSFFANLIGVK
jgi:hypothetical protein